MDSVMERLTIGAFAGAAGVNVETVRYYQRKGLLSEPDKPSGSIRATAKPTSRRAILPADTLSARSIHSRRDVLCAE